MVCAQGSQHRSGNSGIKSKDGAYGTARFARRDRRAGSRVGPGARWEGRRHAFGCGISTVVSLGAWLGPGANVQRERHYGNVLMRDNPSRRELFPVWAQRLFPERRGKWVLTGGTRSKTIRIYHGL